MFYFNVTISHTYQYNVTQSKSYSQVKDDILKDVKERLSSFTNAVKFVKSMTMMSLIFVGLDVPEEISVKRQVRQFLPDLQNEGRGRTEAGTRERGNISAQSEGVLEVHQNVHYWNGEKGNEVLV